jgi:tetratricopeptide (TPR) repeat protein
MQRFGLILMIVVFACASLYAQERTFEQQGNALANSADSLCTLAASKDKADPQVKTLYADAASRYSQAYDLFVQAKEKDQAIVDDKLDRMIRNQTTCYASAEDYVNFIRLIKIQITKDPENVKLVSNLSIAYRKINQPDSAIAVLVRFDSTHPNADAEKKIGMMYLEKARAIDPQDKPLNPDAVEIYRNVLTWLAKSHQQRPDADLIKTIAEIDIRIGDSQAAIRAYEEYLQSNPGDVGKAKAYKLMGKMYEDMKDPVKAAECYAASNTVKYDDQLARKLLQLYSEQGNTAKAKEMVAMILKDKPGDSMAIFYDADMKYKAGDKAGAKAQLQTIVTDPRLGKQAQDYIKIIDAETK